MDASGARTRSVRGLRVLHRARDLLLYLTHHGSPFDRSPGSCFYRCPTTARRAQNSLQPRAIHAAHAPLLQSCTRALIPSRRLAALRMRSAGSTLQDADACTGFASFRAAGPPGRHALYAPTHTPRRTRLQHFAVHPACATRVHPLTVLRRRPPRLSPRRRARSRRSRPSRAAPSWTPTRRL